MLDKAQRLQESEYAFPYHYVPQYDERGRFTNAFMVPFGHVYLSYLRSVVEEIDRVDWRSMLDVGCGDGRLCAVLAERYDRSIQGIDYSEAAVALARAMCPGVDFVAGRVDQRKGELVDLLTSIETLEHIPPAELAGFVAAMRRQVRAGGTLIVTVPSDNLPVSAKHYQHFNVGTLTSALQPHFHPVRIGYLNSTGFLDRLYRRLLMNKLLMVRSGRAWGAYFRFYERCHAKANSTTGARLLGVFRTEDPANN